MGGGLGVGHHHLERAVVVEIRDKALGQGAAVGGAQTGQQQLFVADRDLILGGGQCRVWVWRDSHAVGAE